MQQTIKELQQQIIELKQQQTNSPPAAPSTLATNQTVTMMPGKVVFSQTVSEISGNQAQVTSRHTFNDQQEGAERSGDLTLDPKYHGFIPIPNTPAFIKFNAKPRVDFTSDNRNSGNPDRFVTAQIPVDGESTQGGGRQFNVNARGSSLRLDVRAPDFPGAPRFYYENDFFGSGGGPMPYRIKQLYGEYYNITAGWTYSIFEDPDAWPDTVDFEGPNSMIFARQPTLRYLWQLDKHWQMNFGIQQPSSDVDNFGLPDVTAVNHAPDGGVNVRWEDADIGHVQLAGIFREIGENSPTLGNQNVFGWGLMAATSLNICKDSVQLQGTYGHGYFHFANDNFTYSGFNGGDAAFTSGGNLRALPFFSAMVGYTHHWSDSFRSTATFGFDHLENASSEGPLAYHKTYYASANLIYQIRKRLSVGLEGLYGRKEVKSGADGDVFRVQLGIVWSLFD
jgi:hypothetical protein